MKSSREYYQLILTKVSFSVDLFERELRKAIKRIAPDEMDAFFAWLLTYVFNKPELKAAVLRVKPV